MDTGSTSSFAPWKHQTGVAASALAPWRMPRLRRPPQIGAIAAQRARYFACAPRPQQPTPPARDTAAEMRRAAAVEAAFEQMERDPAKVASAVVDEFGQLFGGVDVAALLGESAAAGEDVHAVAMKLVRDAINIEARRRSSEEGVGAERGCEDERSAKTHALWQVQCGINAY